MFGWFMILSTAVMQKYGLFPNPDVPLQYKDWGAARTVEKGGEGVPAPRVRAPGAAGSPPAGAACEVCERGRLSEGVAAHGLGCARAGLALALKAEERESGPSSPLPRCEPAPLFLPPLS